MSTVIAHEPPLNELLPERADLRRQTADIAATHLAGDVRGAVVEFLALANIDLPPFVLDQMVGAQRTPQDVADDRYQHAHMLIPGTRWQPDLDASWQGVDADRRGDRAATRRGQLCERTSEALAGGLGIAPTRFPGGHIGFVDDPVAFAIRLREVLVPVSARQHETLPAHTRQGLGVGPLRTSRPRRRPVCCPDSLTP